MDFKGLKLFNQPIKAACKQNSFFIIITQLSSRALWWKHICVKQIMVNLGLNLILDFMI